MRINDLKRQQIKLGDIIILTRKPEADQALNVEVLGLSYFKNFTDLFRTLPPELFGWPVAIRVEAQVARMHEYYAEKEELQYGVVAIHIRLLTKRLLDQ